MSALIFPGFAGGNYYTKGVTLSSGSKTTIYTIGDQGEKSAVMLGVWIADSIGSVNTAATVHVTLSSTERVLWTDTPGPDLPLIVDATIAMYAGDILKVTGASGHHVFATFLLEVPAGDRAR